MDIWIRNKNTRMTLHNYNAHKLNKSSELLNEFNQSKIMQNERRSELLSQILPKCRDKMMLIEPPIYVENGSNIDFDGYLFINFGCVILDSAPVKFGDTCLIGPGVHIYATNWNYESRDFKMVETPAKPVTIGDRVWIGGKAKIFPGVTIGDDSVIGAGSFVVNDVPSNVVVAGNPAKIIKYIKNSN